MDYSGLLEREKKKLGEVDIPNEARKAILGFISDMQLEKLSPGRLYAYILRLRTIASVLQERFMNPSENDVKEFFKYFMDKETKWGSGKPHKPTDNAVQAYQVTFKRFYKWYMGHNETYPDCVKWIKIKSPHKSKQKKPESIITESELKQLIDATMNQRDKALLSLLYESGCRISELLTMDIKDLNFDQYGAKITVTGKTGPRVVRIVGDSIFYIKEWLRVHPDKDNLNSPLFTRIDGNVKMRMEYDQVHAMFRKITKRAGFGIDRRIYPHLFRHTRATLLSTVLKEPILEKTMGWVHGSRMTQTYVHLDDKDVDNAVLRSQGFNIDEEQPTVKTPIKCPRCGILQPSYAKVCTNCFMILDQSLAINTTLSMDVNIDGEQKSPGSLTGKIENYDSIKPLLIMIQDMQKSMDDLKKQLNQKT